jgi:RNA polymerase sigma-70 factor, ECF subfamily
MTSARSTSRDDLALLELASKGDEQAFAELVEPHRAELRSYCYRMLGSVHDAEDALQEAMVRAWRGLAGFEGRSTVRSWLYSIATRTAIDVTRGRSRRELPMTFGPAASDAVLDSPITDPVWFEPYPEARYELRESIELAFVVALQVLPAQQRAALILREVLGFSAADIAAHLDTSVPAVNSSLQRARAAVQRELPDRSQASTLRALGDETARAVVRRYADALQAADADTLISLLTADATWSMPPIPNWFTGHDLIREFLVTSPLRERWKHVPAEANGQLALGCYIFDRGCGRYVPAVIDVLTLRGDRISSICGFLLPGDDPDSGEAGQAAANEVFIQFGLPLAPP